MPIIMAVIFLGKCFGRIFDSHAFFLDRREDVYLV